MAGKPCLGQRLGGLQLDSNTSTPDLPSLQPLQLRELTGKESGEAGSRQRELWGRPSLETSVGPSSGRGNSNLESCTALPAKTPQIHWVMSITRTPRVPRVAESEMHDACTDIQNEVNINWFTTKARWVHLQYLTGGWAPLCVCLLLAELLMDAPQGAKQERNRSYRRTVWSVLSKSSQESREMVTWTRKGMQCYRT